MKRKVYLAFILILILIMNSCVPAYEDNDYSDNISWNPQKSFFVQYKINNNRIKFCYSIYLSNKTKDSWEILLSAKFNQSELEGWFSPIDMDDEYLFGLDKNGQDKYVILKPKEEKSVEFWFEGKYLGGEVNTKLTFPELLPVLSDSDDN